MKYGITAKTRTSVKPTSNAILERIQGVLGNLVRTFIMYKQTYVDKNDPWMGILSASAIIIRSTTNRQKGYSLGKFIFVRDMILPIKHRLDWELIRQQKGRKLI